MKKILSLLGLFSLVIVNGANIVACGTSKPPNNQLTLPELKNKFQNNGLLISKDWNSFWGVLSDRLQGESYYQLLMDQLFLQNNINPKYEKDVELQVKNKAGFYVKANTQKLTNLDVKTYSSDTDAQIQITLDGYYAYVPAGIHWSLTPDQKTIYPLVSELQTKNQLTIYDDWDGAYLNHQVPIKMLNEQVKQNFDHEFKGDNNYQYTNFTDSSLENHYIYADGNVNHINLVITNKKASYQVPDFEVYVYNIVEIFNLLNNIYINKPNISVYGPWDNSKDYEDLVWNLSNDWQYQSPPITNYQNYFTYQGDLPIPTKKVPFPGVTTITIWYKKEISAKVRADSF